MGPKEWIEVDSEEQQGSLFGFKIFTDITVKVNYKYMINNPLEE